MSVIKNLLLKLEKLENKYKILQGKFDKLKISVDLVNIKPKELPDAFTYKPQQPYIGKVNNLKLVLSGEEYYLASGFPIIYYDIPIETTDEDKYYLVFGWAKDEGSSRWSIRIVTTYYESRNYFIQLYTDATKWRRWKYKVYEIMV